MEEVANFRCKAISGCKADDSLSYGRLWEGLCMLAMLHPPRHSITAVPHHHARQGFGVKVQLIRIECIFMPEPRYVHFERQLDFLATGETPKVLAS